MPKSAIAQPLARCAACKRKGDFVFLSGIIAVDPVRQKVIAGFADIAPARWPMSIGRA